MPLMDSWTTPVNTLVVVSSRTLPTPLNFGERCIYLGDIVGMAGHVIVAAENGMVVWVAADPTNGLTYAGVLWSVGPIRILWPNVLRGDVKTIKSEITKIQPMTVPIGTIFYMDYKYGQNDAEKDPADK